MTTYDPDLIDWKERSYVSQYSLENFGLAIHGTGGDLVDPDNGGAVTVSWVLQNPDGTTSTVRAMTADRLDVGDYQVTLTSSDTSTTGDYSLEWSWTQAGIVQQYVTYAVVGPANPAYDNLTNDFKALIDDVWIRFADCFDSPSGGPNLTTYYQTYWNRGRIARLMNLALGRINAVAQPHLTYTVDGVGGSVFPLAQWGPLLSTATYIECLKHLRRSYVEQPMFMGGNVTRQDRRDYLDRWGQILLDEQQTYQGELDTFKISLMGFGRPRVLVSGGVYGRFGPTRIAGSVAARPRYYMRFFA